MTPLLTHLSGSVEIGCERLHPGRCAETLRADTADHLLTAAMDHGALVHGFTPVYYSQDRQQAMAGVVTRHLGVSDGAGRQEG